MASCDHVNKYQLLMNQAGVCVSCIFEIIKLIQLSVEGAFKLAYKKSWSIN